LAIPARRIAACALANRTGAGAAEALAFAMLDRAAGWDRLPWAQRFLDQKRAFRRRGEATLAERLARPVAPWPATDVAGRYCHPGYGEVTVTDDLRLLFRHVDLPLEPRPDGTLSADGPSFDQSEVCWDLSPIVTDGRLVALDFAPDASGAVCRFHRDGEDGSPVLTRQGADVSNTSPS
jgi:hypothetical protein